VAKKFLDGEVAKYKDWNHVDGSINVIFSSNSQFQQCKKKRCWASLLAADETISWLFDEQKVKYDSWEELQRGGETATPLISPPKSKQLSGWWKSLKKAGCWASLLSGDETMTGLFDEQKVKNESNNFTYLDMKLCPGQGLLQNKLLDVTTKSKL
jgi:hypothetical protein